MNAGVIPSSTEQSPTPKADMELMQTERLTDALQISYRRSIWRVTHQPIRKTIQKHSVETPFCRTKYPQHYAAIELCQPSYSPPSIVKH